MQYVDTGDPGREPQVRQLVEHGRLALQVARLSVELNRQLDELDRSWARIAQAADEERHRIQRDLHDGAQQRLVTIGIRELTAAAEYAVADRLPGHGELGRYQEFADLSATLTGLYARLDAAYTAQRRFVADASHELRTPLTVQRALIQVALTDPDADAASLRAVCEELLRIGDQQERLVAALLALAQAEQHPAATEPVDLAALASEAVSVRGSAAAEHGLTVRTNIHPAMVTCADPTLLTTLLTSLIGNLLDNAIRHNIDGGRVGVATRQDGPHVVFTVRNTGPVVPADAVDQILQPFQRLDAPRTHNGSTGLGLAIVRAIADSHHADLNVLPNPDGGLTVTVAFAAA